MQQHDIEYESLIGHIDSECKYYSFSDRLNLDNGFTVLHMNMRSLKNKMDDFQTFLHNSGVEWSVICISETWLKPEILKYYNLESYNLFASCREGREGGGPAVYVHNSYNARRCDDISTLGKENAFVEISNKGSCQSKTIIVGGLYRPPTTPHLPFMNYLEEVLVKLTEERKTVVLAGDFNYNLLNQSQDKHVLSFSNLLNSYGYYHLIAKATRIDREISSLLDNIFVNDHNFAKSSGVIIHDLSDHFPVFAVFSFDKPLPLKPTLRKVFDASKFKELNDFLVSRLVDFQSISDPNVACDVLLRTFEEGIDKFSKTYLPSRRKTPMKPWLSSSILCSINHKNRLYKKFIRSPSLLNENNYKHYRNMLTNIIREAKRLYFQKSFSDNIGNGKETWRLLREALNTKPRTADHPDVFSDDVGKSYENEDIASGFNDFFVSIGQRLEEAVPASDRNPIDNLGDMNFPIYDNPLSTTSSQIENIFKSLNPVGGGIDKISTKIILGTYKICLHHLTYFFNLCLHTATFPDRLKVALVIPIFKSGDKHRFTNYRPISLLSVFSKILEILLHDNLSSFLEETSILFEHQFGFRKKTRHLYAHRSYCRRGD